MVTRGKKMPVLLVKGKTGFRNVSGQPILILDERGERFYDTRQLLKRVQMFNLPEGTYYVALGDIARMSRPVNYELTPLPEKERHMFGSFENFDVHFVNNPATGTVVPAANEKFYDHALKELPLPYAMFIDEHENGHKYYITESYCDQYAVNKMLERGYNPSQISEAIVLTLSPDKAARKEIIVESLLPSNAAYNANGVASGTDPVVGMFVTSTKPVNVYKSPGEAIAKVVQPGKYIGKVAKLNSARTWLQLTDTGVISNGWIFISSDINFRPGENLPPLTTEQKNQILRGVLEDWGKSGAVPHVDLVLKAKDVAEGAGKTAETIANVGVNLTKFIGNNALIILIVLALLFLAIGYKRLKS